MAKKREDFTPRSQIVSALRNLWMRSRERSFSIKQTGSRCCLCGGKQTMAKGKELKLCSHHERRPNWDRIVAVIREELLQKPSVLWALCVPCHKRLHIAERQGVSDRDYADAYLDAHKNKGETND